MYRAWELAKYIINQSIVYPHFQGAAQRLQKALYGLTSFGLFADALAEKKPRLGSCCPFSPEIRCGTNLTSSAVGRPPCFK